jgi:archaellum component FlaG (FlaF/FlaG flagellin family)
MTTTTKTDDLMKGDRIRLIYTADRYTRLRPGDMGSVLEVWKDDTPYKRVSVKWDSGISNLNLIDGVDLFSKRGT